MKAVLLVLWFSLPLLAFCEENASESKVNLRRLLFESSYDQLVQNSPQIASLSYDLSGPERESLYAEFEKPVWPWILNVLPGGGMGSFVQKDYVWSGCLLAGSVVSGGIAGVGVLYFLSGILGSGYGAGSSSNAQMGLILMGVGAVSGLTGMVVGGVRAGYFATSYNQELRRSLFPDASQ